MLCITDYVFKNDFASILCHLRWNPEKLKVFDREMDIHKGQNKGKIKGQDKGQIKGQSKGFVARKLNEFAYNPNLYSGPK